MQISAKLCNLIMSVLKDSFEIKPQYNSVNHFLFLTRVLSLQDVSLRNMVYFVFIKLSSGKALWSKLRSTGAELHKLAIKYQSPFENWKKLNLTYSFY